MNVKGTYTIKENMGSYDLEIDYEYYIKKPTHYDPLEDQLDIKQVRLNGMDITKFYWDYLDEDMFIDVYEYAVENKYENHE
tara:strand:+ start:219 stop:461 length:243 start_codon:yes stop_codon:yes gene_type:complete